MIPSPRSTLAAIAPIICLPALVVYLYLVSFFTTQRLAAAFHYQLVLGPRGPFGVYPAFAWMGWLAKFYRSAPDYFQRAFFWFTGLACAGFLAYALIIGFVSRRMKKNPNLHGSAHEATHAEIMATGLLPAPGERGTGVYCGGWTDKLGRLHYLRHDGPEHVAAIAPTRSGKGVGLVIPTLLSWSDSVVVNDQKGELYNLTSGWRAAEAGNLILKFDPTSPTGDSISINPLSEIRMDSNFAVGDVQNIATIIADPEGNGLDDHWAKTGHAFLVGLILHVKCQETEHRPASLEDVARALANPDQTAVELYTAMLQNDYQAAEGVSDTIKGAARAMLNRSANERSGVHSTAETYLTLYVDPNIARHIRYSDVRINDLMNAPTPVSLYLVVSVEDKERLKPLMRLIINQLLRVLMRPRLTYVNGREQRPHARRLLMMIDEFPALGRLQVFEESLAFIAGYGIKAYLIMQDINQLKARYGEHETIISNCHVKIAYAPNRIETAEWISKNAGVTTIITEHLSTSGARFGAVLQNVTRSYHETSRPLFTADEAMRLKAPQKDRKDQIVEPGELLVFVSGHAPIRGTQSLYFRDGSFLKRAKIPPAPSGTLRRAVAESAPASPSPILAPPREDKIPMAPAVAETWVNPVTGETERQDYSGDHWTPQDSDDPPLNVSGLRRSA
jgi:type IV secretion system protein VirD4